MTNNTQFTRKDVEQFINDVDPAWPTHPDDMREFIKAVKALLTDMDAAVKALDWVRHNPSESPAAMRRVEDALEKYAKWRVV